MLEPLDVEEAGALVDPESAQLGSSASRRLLLVVVAAGFGSTATEICASRLLAPYFGTSTVVWANVIGLVLAALSVGYWFGGRVADRRPRPSVLGGIVVAAGALIAVVPFAAHPLLDLTVRGL